MLVQFGKDSFRYLGVSSVRVWCSRFAQDLLQLHRLVLLPFVPIDQIYSSFGESLLNSGSTSSTIACTAIPHSLLARILSRPRLLGTRRSLSSAAQPRESGTDRGERRAHVHQLCALHIGSDLHPAGLRLVRRRPSHVASCHATDWLKAL